MIRVSRIIVRINIAGSILSTTDDNILLPSLCGTFDILPVLTSLINPANRKIWNNRNYNSNTTPHIEYYIVVGNSMLPINSNQLISFKQALHNTSLGYVDSKLNLITE